MSTNKSKPASKTAAKALKKAVEKRPLSKLAAARLAESKELQFIIDSAWERRATLTLEEIEGSMRPAVDRAIAGLEKGWLRVAEPDGNGTWKVNE